MYRQWRECTKAIIAGGEEVLGSPAQVRTLLATRNGVTKAWQAEACIVAMAEWLRRYLANPAMLFAKFAKLGDVDNCATASPPTLSPPP